MSDSPDMSTWFTEHELRPCPRCNERRLVPGQEGRPEICLDCGVLLEQEAEHTPLQDVA